MNSKYFLSLKPIRSRLPLDTLQRYLQGGLQNTPLYSLFLESQTSREAKSCSAAILFFGVGVICFLLTWPHFYLLHYYCTSCLGFLCAFCYPSSPTDASSHLYLCSRFKERSLNHIRFGSFAKHRLLY